MPEKNLIRRPFATGSKPGPDAIDHYLEEQGFYRKHVARDPSSLFRVISEQVLDIQEYHNKFRQDCASFMEIHSKEYSNEVDKNFYNYIATLRKLRTPATLLELRVMARMYKKNVILFEPNQNNTQTTQRTYVYDENNSKEPIRVFYSHKDKHFDTIYTMDYIEKLAECQSIVYEVLYKDVFKLPDVKYAVERMLHDQKGEVTLPLTDDATKYKTANGEIYDFDTAENTCCVLKDADTCAFHNPDDFENVVKKNQDAITIINRGDDPGRLKIYKPVDGYLYKKEVSCVRQLLDENITPFPYKVAKALDPSIYRNTEFELWHDTRKEHRQKWRDIDEKIFMYGNYNRYSYDQVLDEEEYMHLDEDVKKKYVFVNPRVEDNLMSELKNLGSNYDHFRPSREALEPIVMPMQANYRPPYRRRQYFNRHWNNQHNNNYAPVYDQREYEAEQPAYQQQQQQIPAQAIFQDNNGTSYQYVPYTDNNSPTMYPAQIMQYIPQSPYSQVQMAYTPQPTYAAQQAYNQSVPYTNFSIPPPNIITCPPPALSVNTNIASAQNTDFLNLIREDELASGNFNQNPKECHDANELPLNDINSIKFFYNIGVRYFFAAGLQSRLETVATTMEGLTINHETNSGSSNNDQQQGDGLKSDHPPPVPANTPVATRPMNSVFVPANRPHYGNNFRSDNRRSYNQNGREFRNGDGKDGNKGRNHYNNNRKEIQFNSNVKNLHKADSNLQKNNSNGSAAGNGQNHITVSATSTGMSQTNGTGSATSSSLSPMMHGSDNYANDNQVAQNGMHTVAPQVHTQQPQLMPFSPQPYYQAQTIVPQTPQYAPQTPQYTLCYQNENGEVMPMQQSYQPVYYQQAMYQPTPQTPVYFQTSPQPQMLDPVYPHDMNADAQHGNGNAYGAAFAPAGYTSYIYQQPGQIYYPPTPIIQTPQLSVQASMTPVFPQIQAAPVVSPTPAITEIVSNDSGNPNTDSSTVAPTVNSEPA